MAKLKKKSLIKVWAVRYLDGIRSLIAISHRKKKPKFTDDSFSPVSDHNSYDLFPSDLGNIKLPLNKIVRLKISIEEIK